MMRLSFPPKCRGFPGSWFLVSAWVIAKKGGKLVREEDDKPRRRARPRLHSPPHPCNDGCCSRPIVQRGAFRCCYVVCRKRRGERARAVNVSHTPERKTHVRSFQSDREKMEARVLFSFLVLFIHGILYHSKERSTVSPFIFRRKYGRLDISKVKFVVWACFFFPLPLFSQQVQGRQFIPSEYKKTCGASVGSFNRFVTFICKKASSQEKFLE